MDILEPDDFLEFFGLHGVDVFAYSVKAHHAEFKGHDLAVFFGCPSY